MAQVSQHSLLPAPLLLPHHLRSPASASLNPPPPPRLLPLADLEPFLGRVKDATLRHSLSYGVGYLHETMGAQEQAVVNTLFSSGAIQVCCRSCCSCCAACHVTTS
jgi:hypothetical protein